MSSPAMAQERVLATLNVDGSRRWLRPRWSPGRWADRRRLTAYGLIALFLALPHVRIGGRPAMQLDLATRQFTLVGTTFLPTETVLLLLLLLSLFIGVFLFTALFGRVWCGWACPQTVWMEFLFRPVERWIEGSLVRSRALDARGWRGHFAPVRLVKYAIYGGIAVVLGNTFLMYFAGSDRVFEWMRTDPREHWVPFAVMAITSAAVFFDFTYFREQTCLVACPYGRIQSALLDRQSLIVAYDQARGEPRGRGRARPGLGDCVDCGACVATCPTGIDIRDGLQLECIHCTQCMDACDAVMTKLGRPTGLVRYGSRAEMEGAPVARLRARTVLYPAALCVTVGLFAWNLGRRSDAEVTMLRGAGAAPFVEQANGLVSNQVRVKVENRSDRARTFTLRLVDPAGATFIAPVNPMPVDPWARATSSVFILVPRSAFAQGRLPMALELSDGAGFRRTVTYHLLGPQ